LSKSRIITIARRRKKSKRVKRKGVEKNETCTSEIGMKRSSKRRAAYEKISLEIRRRRNGRRNKEERLQDVAYLKAEGTVRLPKK
jgi:hypothetical protein